MGVVVNRKAIVLSILMFVMAGVVHAELVQHLDATVAGSVTGNPVTQWADQSGYNNHALKKTGNVYYPSTSLSASGLAGLDFFGSSANSLELFTAAESDSWLNQTSGSKKATENKGYQGTGYADLSEKGDSVEWDNVLADNNGQYALTFRYSSVGDCPCELIVNGQKAGTIPFKSTKKYTSWKTVDVKADLKKGGNFIKVIAVSEGPMLDAIAVNKGN
jgi:hypothetical protein